MELPDVSKTQQTAPAQSNADEMARLMRFADEADQNLKQWEQSPAEFLRVPALKSWFATLEHPFYNVYMATFCATLQPWITARPNDDVKGLSLASILQTAEKTVTAGNVKKADYLAFEREVQKISQENPTFFDADDSCEETSIQSPLDALRRIEQVVGRPALEDRLERLRGRTFTLIGTIKNAQRALLSSNFETISWRAFEYFVAMLLNEMGYETEVTPGTGDFGTDIVARANDQVIAVQCKKNREGQNIGNDKVQMLLGAMQLTTLKATSGILVTTSHFTRQAIRQAEGTSVVLWDKEVLHNLVSRHMLEG